MLAPLSQGEFRPIAVYTQPDRPKGRGRKLKANEVKKLATELEIEVLQPASLRDADAQETLRRLDPDVLIVAAYGLILPPAVLDIPTYGCINVHASLLPRWRGAAPIERALIAGDTKTGVCIMHMEAGLDTGPVYATDELAIDATVDAAELELELASRGATLLTSVLQQLLAFHSQRASHQGKSLAPERFLEEHATAQSDSGVIYAHKLTPEDRVIDWHTSADTIARQIQALRHRQPVRTRLGDVGIRFLAAHVINQNVTDGAPPPGTLLDASKEAISIQCAIDILQITQLQFEKGKGTTLDPAAALNGYKRLFVPGARFA